MNETPKDTYRMQEGSLSPVPWGGSPHGGYYDPVMTEKAQSAPAPMPPCHQHGLSADVIGSPSSAQEAYQGSLRGMLGREIGAYIAATFLMGNGELVRWAGRLYEVGNNYIAIYQQEQGRYVVGDLNSLRFVEFSETGRQTPIAARPCNDGPTAW